MNPPHATREALRAVALFEALKGVLAIAAALGLLAFLHRDLQHFADELVELLRLHADGRFALSITAAVQRASEFHAATVVAVAGGYAALRLFEAYGLWHSRAWAEWFAVVGGGLYIPFEVEHLVHGHHRLITLSALAINLLIVAVMVRALLARRRQRLPPASRQ